MTENEENRKLGEPTHLTEGKSEKINAYLKEFFGKVDVNDLEDGLDEIVSMAFTSPEASEHYSLEQLDNYRFLVRQIQKYLLKIHAVL